MEFRILGELEVRSDGAARSLGGVKLRVVLAVLLVHANEPVSAERLAFALWGQEAPAGAVKTVQMHVSRLRKALGDAEILQTTPGGYRLRVRPGELDVERFALLAEDGQRALAAGKAEHAAGVLREALGLWRGPAMADLAFEAFAQPEIARLEEQRLNVLEARVDADLAAGRHAALVGELQHLVGAHPARERLAGQLMLALYRCGRQADALEGYQAARRALVEAFGVEPGPALRGLQDAILHHDASLQAPSAIADLPPHLQAALETVLYGRDRELRFLAGRWRSARAGAGTLVTIIGPRAIGKTRLTAELALRAHRDGATVLYAAGSGPAEGILASLAAVGAATRPTLLVLDDADKAGVDVLAAAQNLTEVLVTRPVMVLATGQDAQALACLGEDVLRLEALDEQAVRAIAVGYAPNRPRADVPAEWLLDASAGVPAQVHEVARQWARRDAARRVGTQDERAASRRAELRSIEAELAGDVIEPQAGGDLPALPTERDTATVAPVSGAAGGSCRAAGPLRLPLARALHAPMGSPFVGRDTELTCLRERWKEVCGGAHAAVVLGGEPGIGKTRLASELARAVHEQGALVLYGRCDEGLAVPYQPFVEALRPYARAVGLECLRAELGHLAPELGRLLPELAALGEPIRADPESERFALFDAVAALVEAMTREQRALLVVDDLHWAARPTLLMLRHLVRSERPLAALLLCTYRETELDSGHQLAQLLADLHRDASAERLSIRGLDEHGIAALLDATVGPAPDERSQLVRVLGAQTDGNPFFLRELLAHLMESGTISPRNECLGAGVTAEQLEAPEGLQHVIRQRVARLSASAGRALSVAAVAGPTFSFVLLERILGERSGVLDALDEANSAALLTEAGHGDYAFAHALVRQTIYEQLGAARRIRLHRLLGEALEALGDAQGHLEALAHHFAQAAADGQGVKAAAYALAAGRRAIGRLSYEEAAAHYERGLDALKLTVQPHGDRRCELLLALGEARLGAGELDNARRAYGQAAELADELGDVTALGRAALGFCGPHRIEGASARTRPVASILDRALAALSDGDSALRAQLMGRLAHMEHGAPSLARQALQMARRVADKAALADVLASSHWATSRPNTLHESLALARELAEVAEELGDQPLQAVAHWWLIDILLDQGDIEAVHRKLQALQRLTQTRREHQFKGLSAALLARHAHLEGRLEDCETLAHEAFGHRLEGHDDNAAQTLGVQILFIRREQGRLDELVDAVEGFVAEHPQFAGWRCALSSIYAQLGRSAQAREQFEALAHDDFCDLPRDPFWLTNLSGLCEVATFLDDARRSRLLYELLLPYAERYLVIAAVCQGSSSRPLGLLATTLSRYDDATRHFEDALTMNVRIRSPLWIAHTQHDYAHMLLTRGRPRDNDKIIELLEQALATAEELGLKALADKARPLKLTAQTAGPPAALPEPKCGPI